MSLSPRTKLKMLEAAQFMEDGWSLTLALKKAGINISNDQYSWIKKTDEYIALKEIYEEKKQNKYNKGVNYELMGKIR